MLFHYPPESIAEQVLYGNLKLQLSGIILVLFGSRYQLIKSILLAPKCTVYVGYLWRCEILNQLQIYNCTVRVKIRAHKPPFVRFRINRQH